MSGSHPHATAHTVLRALPDRPDHLTLLVSRTEHERRVQALRLPVPRADRRRRASRRSSILVTATSTPSPVSRTPRPRPIGRVLANLGLTASAQRPSREESALRPTVERALRVSEASPSAPNDSPTARECRAAAERRPGKWTRGGAVAQRAGLSPAARAASARPSRGPR